MKPTRENKIICIMLILFIFMALGLALQIGAITAFKILLTWCLTCVVWGVKVSLAILIFQIVDRKFIRRIKS